MGNVIDVTLLPRALVRVRKMAVVLLSTISYLPHPQAGSLALPILGGYHLIQQALALVHSAYDQVEKHGPPINDSYARIFTKR